MSQPTVAILGASNKAEKFGYKAVTAHLRQGYQVFPVNPRGGEIQGLEVFKTLAEVPVDHLDRISVYLPPEIGLTVLEEIAAKGCDEFWLNPGSESQAVVERAKELGLDPIIACSIVDLGIDPRQLDD